MYNYQDKLNNLTDSSVWVFTKQSILFDTAYKAVKLLAEMPNRKQRNDVETYFENNHKRYSINTDRHRVLVISQLFGLLTKTPPYERGGRYNTEQPTEIFERLNKYPIGSNEYNVIKTEQILKMKIKAIIDTADNNKDWNILPIIFTYKVLKILKEKYKIDYVDLEQFYTYVMTCADYSEIDEAVEFIKENRPVSNFVSTYKSNSRFLTLCKNNFKLFNIDNKKISINDIYDNYFNDNFMEMFDIDELNIQLSRYVDYIYFLTSYQNFNINLIDTPKQNYISSQSKVEKLKTKKVVIGEDGSVEDDDIDYILKVDKVKEFNINPEISKDAYKVKPIISMGAIAKRYSKNPMVGKIAINQVDYKCENNNEHTTFISNTTRNQYMEAHHLIPISYQEEMWDRFNVNIDCVENIVSLCPNCHRAIHYAVKEFKEEIISKMYKLKEIGLKKIGIDIPLEEVIKLYLD